MFWNPSFKVYFGSILGLFWAGCVVAIAESLRMKIAHAFYISNEIG